jgi:hypothetical protein
MLPVRADLDLRLVLGAQRTATVPVRLVYSAADPWAVTAIFSTSEGDVTWVFGRELLEAGVSGPAGEGDVAVWPVRGGDRGADLLYLSLASPHGSALLEADLATVLAFLEDSYDAVPSGTESEHLHVDDAIARILGA